MFSPPSSSVRAVANVSFHLRPPELTLIMEEINSWDEFVPADRLRKMNEENLRLQKELNDNTKPSSKRTNPTPNAKGGMKMSSKAGSEDLPGASGTLPPRGQKRGRELEIEKVCL